MQVQATMSEKTKSYAWIPWAIVAFFVVIAILDGIFVYLATSTHTGVVTEHAYKEGLAYNDTIAEAEKQATYGWSGRIGYASVARAGEGLLSFGLEAGEQQISGAQVYAVISRPTHDGQDFKVTLSENAPGVYAEVVRFPALGQWDVRVYVEWQNKAYQQHRRLVVR